MPTYEYECTACSGIFELFHGINDNPKVQCPSCGAEAKRRISCGAGFIMKGGSSAALSPQCGREEPCCGRSAPCGKSSECHD